MEEFDYYEEVAKVAYELYQKRGGSHGFDVDDWLEAEKIVRNRREQEHEGVEGGPFQIKNTWHS
jgi:hypothetical protein